MQGLQLLRKIRLLTTFSSSFQILTRYCLTAENIANILKSFDVILSSPLKRAHQTASIVAREMGYKDKSEHSDFFRPRAQIDGLMSSLPNSGRAKKQSILLIGHEPEKPKMISSLTCIPPDSIGF